MVVHLGRFYPISEQGDGLDKVPRLPLIHSPLKELQLSVRLCTLILSHYKEGAQKYICHAIKVVHGPWLYIFNGQYFSEEGCAVFPEKADTQLEQLDNYVGITTDSSFPRNPSVKCYVREL